jgi:aminoglycoside phosphotransferase (APT) family kinase protein
MPEEQLPGGFVSHVVRIGDTIRRSPGPNSEFVRQLLALLGQAGWDGAPRFLGTDRQGRETLSFLDGHVAWQASQSADIGSDDSLAKAAQLVRQFHDLTAGTELAGGSEVVCHNDLSPKNTVYRDLGTGLRPVAFIDWDIAAPGLRIHDVAHVCWQFPGLGPDAGDPAQAARRVRLICDAYGLADRSAVADTIAWWQERCWRGIRAGAAEGDPAMTRLHAAGATAAVREQGRWTARHRAVLDNALC